MLKSAAEMKRTSSKENQFVLKLGEEINIVGRAIQMAAQDGKTSLDYKIENSDENFIGKVVGELKFNGYDVIRTNNKLKITWG